jgi:hypothetical protein
MKKLFITLVLIFSFTAFTSESHAQSPQVYAIGTMSQSDDATLVFNYNAIESNQPVYEFYDVGVIGDYYENNIYLGGMESSGINYAEISVQIPATPYNFYQQIAYYYLRPIQLCPSGFMDWYGFSVCYGGEYLLPYTFIGNCAPICIPTSFILLGASLLEIQVLPTVRLNDGPAFTFNPATVGSANRTTEFTFSIRGSTGLPPGVKVIAEYGANKVTGSGEIGLGIAAGDDPTLEINHIPVTAGVSTDKTIKFNPTGTPPFSFKVDVNLRKAGTADPASYLIINSPQTSTAICTVNP